MLSNDETLLDRSTIPVDDIVDLLDFFKYNDTCYQQIFGTALGSPVSAVMANLVMEDLEKRALSTSIVQPCFWKRYVDDVCAAVSSSLVQTSQHRAIDPVYVRKRNKSENIFSGRYCLSSRQRSTFH